MQNLIKTTITLPEDLFQLAKMKAVKDKTNLSALVRAGLLQQILPQKSQKQQPNIMSFFGSLKSVAKASSYTEARKKTAIKLSKKYQTYE
jgi:hypothetical protein